MIAIVPLPLLHADGEEGGDVFTLKARFNDIFTWYRTDTYSKTLERRDLIANLARLRLTPELNFSDILLLHVDYDNEVLNGNYLKSVEFDRFWRDPYSDYNDLFDLTKEVKYTEDYLYRTKIHRAYAKLVLGDFTLTAGRQQIRFGSGRLWNPLDIMNPISPVSLEGAEEQKGVDALRAEYFLNAYTVLSVVADRKRAGEDSTGKPGSGTTGALGRLKTTVLGADIAALAGKMHHRDVAGADITVVFLDGNLRGSALRTKHEDLEPRVQAGGGFEYNFAFGLYFLVEYFFNENALNFNEELKYAYLSSLAFGFDESSYSLLSNQFITFNKHYLALALGYDITPLIRMELFALCDVQGRSVLLNPTLRYNIFQDVDLTVSAMKTWIHRGAEYESDFEYLRKYPLVYATFTWYLM